MIREVIFYKNYFSDFYSAQTPKVQRKIEYILKLVSTVERVPEKFLKHLTGTNGLYEIRIEHSNNIFRVFCFFDKGTLVVLLQGFQKKSKKTPLREIEKAERLKQQYLRGKKMKL